MIACTLFLPIFTAAKDEKYFNQHNIAATAQTAHAWGNVLATFSLSAKKNVRRKQNQNLKIKLLLCTFVGS